MKNEMEMMNMDERQRLAWFMANRGTVIAIGAVWLGMIGWELVHERMPTFLLIMVPVFALLRASLYFYYSSRPFAGTDSPSDSRFVRYGKITAATLLAIAILLPIYTFDSGAGEELSTGYVWRFVGDDFIAILPLGFAYLWPLLILGLSRIKSRRLPSILVQFAEPVLAVVSSIIIMWIPKLIFETVPLFVFIIVPVSPNPEWGCYLAVIANGLYLASWFAGLLRPWGVQEG